MDDCPAVNLRFSRIYVPLSLVCMTVKLARVVMWPASPSLVEAVFLVADFNVV